MYQKKKKKNYIFLKIFNYNKKNIFKKIDFINN